MNVPVLVHSDSNNNNMIPCHSFNVDYTFIMIQQ